MDLFINQKEYVAHPATEAGVRVVIHKRGSVPFPEDNGITAMPGQSTSIGIRKNMFSRLPPPHGVCANTGHVVDYYHKYLGTDYSKLSCLKSCYQNIIMDVCDCAVPFYFVPPHKDVCNMTNTTVDKCVTELPDVYPERYQSCDKMCPQPCEETNFDVSISSSEWPSDKYKECLSKKLEQTNSLYKNKTIKDDFLKIHIYYQDLIYEHIQQRKAFESMNLISDLGGQLGLWLGLSAITIGELCSLLFALGRLLPFNWYQGAKTSPTVTPPSLNAAQSAIQDDLYDDFSPEQAKHMVRDFVETRPDAESVEDRNA